MDVIGYLYAYGNDFCLGINVFISELVIRQTVGTSSLTAMSSSMGSCMFHRQGKITCANSFSCSWFSNQFQTLCSSNALCSDIN